MLLQFMPADMLSAIIKYLYPSDILSALMTCKNMYNLIKKTAHYEKISKIYPIILDKIDMFYQNCVMYYATTEVMSSTLRFIRLPNNDEYEITMYISTQYGDFYINYEYQKPSMLKINCRSGGVTIYTTSYHDEPHFIMKRIVLHLYGRLAYTTGIIDLFSKFCVTHEMYPNRTLVEQILLCNAQLGT